jgi:hypothetical protein
MEFDAVGVLCIFAVWALAPNDFSRMFALQVPMGPAVPATTPMGQEIVLLIRARVCFHVFCRRPPKGAGLLDWG